jgi:hypothetical protein
MTQDIRDKPAIRHEDVVGLNFIRTGGPFVFRRHFRHGLRSHIMEILKSADVEAENAGIVVAGNRRFPRARPTHMLRIFRTRLQTLESALAEIERVKAVTAYLGSDFIARSSEFLVDYHGPEGTAIMLCGFQRYIEGEMLDPWSLLDRSRLLPSLYTSLYAPSEHSDDHRRAWIEATRLEGARFIEAAKRMIAEVGHIPDLAGAGNLLVTKAGRIKLVDINNITPVVFDDQIHLDDKGYPVCDKSIEALSLMEQKVIGRPADTGEALYRFFLDPERRRQVRRQEEAFYRGDVF